MELPTCITFRMYSESFLFAILITYRFPDVPRVENLGLFYLAVLLEGLEFLVNARPVERQIVDGNIANELADYLGGGDALGVCVHDLENNRLFF